MPTLISKAVAATSLGTGVADTQIGGASQYTPEWARRVMGLRTATIAITPTTQEATHGTAWLSSNSFSPNPSRVLFAAQTGSVATNSLPAGPKNEYFPMHYKCHGGEPYDVYGKAAVANTAAPYMAAEVFFGTEDATMASKLDQYPTAVEVYYDVADYDATTIASTAQAFPAITITGAKAVTELIGYVLKTATAEKKGTIGYFRFASNGFETSPIDMLLEPANSTLGTVTGEYTPQLSRDPVQVGCSPTTVINGTYYQGGGVALTTETSNVGVAFVRDWGR